MNRTSTLTDITIIGLVLFFGIMGQIDNLKEDLKKEISEIKKIQNSNYDSLSRIESGMPQFSGQFAKDQLGDHVDVVDGDMVQIRWGGKYIWLNPHTGEWTEVK